MTVSKVPETTTVRMAQHLEINGLLYTGFMDSVGIDMAENQHDKAMITVRLHKSMDYRTGPGCRVRFEYGRKPSKVFFGYITDVSPAVNMRQGLYQQTISALGTSTVLKSGRPRFFDDVSVPEVVRQVALDNRLGFNDETDQTRSSYRWPALAQTEESDWEFICYLANMVGAVIIAQDGVVRLVTPEYAQDKYIPVTEFRSKSQYDDEILYEFKPLNFSPDLPESHEPVVGLLSGKDVLVRQTPSTPSGLGTRFATGRAFSSMEEAALLQKTSLNDPRWVAEAVAEVGGLRSLVPGVTASFRTSQKVFSQSPFDGPWYVAQVTHEITMTSYRSHLLLRRYPYHLLSAVRAPNWWYGKKGAPTVQASHDNKWVSTWRV